MSDVDAFLQELSHPRKEEIAAVRAAIVAADNGITERIKWNAPSFCWAGDDRVTFRLRPGDRFELIFHRGAKKRDDELVFEDESGLMEWVSADRAVVTLPDDEDARDKIPVLTQLVGAWMRATG